MARTSLNNQREVTMKTLRQLLVVALVVATTASYAAAQTFTGGLRGAVKDANGVIPGVTVELINEGTSATRDAVSNESGEYSFGAVQPGTYTVKASLTGFRTFETKGVRIATQQFVTLDITLEVGQLQETVTVTGAAPLIDTSNASTGGVIDSQQLATLPSGGRSAFLFAVTVPTVVASGDAQFNRQQDQTNASLLSLGGGARRANNYLIDGVPITDLRNRATANPTLEAVEGVNVQVHQYDAETGRTGGGTFNVATKSGTNDWHGSGFYQNRPNWGTSNNFYSRLGNVPKPDLYFHTGAGGFGGPIVKNRTFFWAATEGYGSNTTRNAPGRVPTAREKAGDFSQTFNAAGQLVVIYDPLTGDANGQNRTPFPGNIIPANRLNPVTSKMLSYLPNPTRAQQLRQHRRDRRPRHHVYGQGRPPLERRAVVAGLLPLQQDQRALRQPADQAERPERVRRAQRLHPEAPRPHRRAEQHLAARQQHGGHGPLRLHALQRPEHPVGGIRSVAARLLAVVPERAAGEEVPARDDDRLHVDRRHRPQQADLVLAGRQHGRVEAGRPPHVQGRRRLPSGRCRHPVVLGRRGSLRVRPLLHLVEPDRSQHHLGQRRGQHAARLSLG